MNKHIILYSIAYFQHFIHIYISIQLWACIVKIAYIHMKYKNNYKEICFVIK